MISKPRGTVDRFDDQAELIYTIIDLFNNEAKLYNFSYCVTPTFEQDTLFLRSIGTDTDIIQKEIYQFSDKKNRMLALRPEGTAGVIRALIENKLLFNRTLPMKLFYYGPMFRYERPQAGRHREFYQWGIECIGVLDKNIIFEIISFAARLLTILGLKKFKIKINHLARFEVREKYISDLVEYLAKKYDILCQNCKLRYKTNPLRVLDCKVDAPKLVDLPLISGYWNEVQKNEINWINNELNKLGYFSTINPELVRGLDYYNDIVFEIVWNDQNFSYSKDTLIGGGCYSNLIKQLDGPDLPALGFAVGIDRLIMILNYYQKNIFENQNNLIYFLTIDDKSKNEAAKFVVKLREFLIKCDYNYLSRSIRSQYNSAEKLGSKYTAVIGNNEINQQKLIIKNQISGEQKCVFFNDLIDFIRNLV